MKPEANATARRKSGRRDRTRTEAAASRGGGSSAPAGVPVRRKRTAEVGCSGLGPHRSVTPKLAARQPVRRGQGLASWEHLARTKIEREPVVGEKRPLAHQRGVTLRGARDSRRAASARSGFFPKGSGARVDSNRRRLWAKEIGVASRRAGGGGLGGSSPRSFGCEAEEREEGSRRRRQRRRSQTTSSSEYLDEWFERSRRSKLVCVNRRSFSSEPEATPANRSSDESTGAER